MVATGDDDGVIKVQSGFKFENAPKQHVNENSFSK